MPDKFYLLGLTRDGCHGVADLKLFNTDATLGGLYSRTSQEARDDILLGAILGGAILVVGLR
jgi:hypothetical protein